MIFFDIENHQQTHVMLHDMSLKRIMSRSPTISKIRLSDFESFTKTLPCFLLSRVACGANREKKTSHIVAMVFFDRYIKIYLSHQKILQIPHIYVHKTLVMI